MEGTNECMYLNEVFILLGIELGVGPKINWHNQKALSKKGVPKICVCFTKLVLFSQLPAVK